MCVCGRGGRGFPVGALSRNTTALGTTVGWQLAPHKRRDYKL